MSHSSVSTFHLEFSPENPFQLRNRYLFSTLLTGAVQQFKSGPTIAIASQQLGLVFQVHSFPWSWLFLSTIALLFVLFRPISQSKTQFSSLRNTRTTNRLKEVMSSSSRLLLATQQTQAIHAWQLQQFPWQNYATGLQVSQQLEAWVTTQSSPRAEFPSEHSTSIT